MWKWQKWHDKNFYYILVIYIVSIDNRFANLLLSIDNIREKPTKKTLQKVLYIPPFKDRHFKQLITKYQGRSVGPSKFWKLWSSTQIEFVYNNLLHKDSRDASTLMFLEIGIQQITIGIEWTSKFIVLKRSVRRWKHGDQCFVWNGTRN